MNQQAIYRSVWDEDTIETSCEITPTGEIVNVVVVEAPDVEHLISEEVELLFSGKTYDIEYDDDNAPVIANIDNFIRYPALKVDSGHPEPCVIHLNTFGIEVTLTGDGGGSITSKLKEGHPQYDAAIDGIESMILAHAIAGIDVNSPLYLGGIETAVQGAANQSDDIQPKPVGCNPIVTLVEITANGSDVGLYLNRKQIITADPSIGEDTALVKSMASALAESFNVALVETVCAPYEDWIWEEVEDIVINPYVPEVDTSKISVSEEHPDYQKENSTMSCLDNDTFISVAINLKRELGKCQNIGVTAKNIMANISSNPYVDSIHIEIGTSETSKD